jgi:hypothetical protein
MMGILPVKLLLGAAWLLPFAEGSRRANSMFEVNVTFSDDGLTISLEPFLLQLFETDGDFPELTNRRVAQALDTFLLAEMNAVYAPDREIEVINTTVVSDIAVEMEGNDERRSLLQKSPLTYQDRIAWLMSRGAADTVYDEQKFLRGKRNLDTIVGSELELYVNITFDRVPAPTREDVENASRLVMVDLQYFITNLTVFNDPELQNVRLAFRKEIAVSTSAPVSSVAPASAAPVDVPTVAGDGGSNPTTPTSPVSPPSIETSVPTTVTPSPTEAPVIASPPSSISTTNPVTLAPAPAPSTAQPASPTESPTPLPSTSYNQNPTLSPSIGSGASSPDDGNLPTQAGPTSPAPSSAPFTSSPSPTETDVDRIDFGPPISGTKDNGGSDNTVLITTVIVGAALLALVGVLLVRRRRHHLDQTEEAYMDVQSDAESLDQSIQSINNIGKDINLMEDDNGESVFAGLESPSHLASPRIRKTKTGFSFSSATTIKANNVAAKTGAPTPRSLLTAGSRSLFAFSEEEEEDEQEEEELANAARNVDVSATNDMVKAVATPSALRGRKMNTPSTDAAVVHDMIERDLSTIEKRSLFQQKEQASSLASSSKEATTCKGKPASNTLDKSVSSGGAVAAAAVAGATAAGAAVIALMPGRHRRRSKQVSDGTSDMSVVSASQGHEAVNAVPGDDQADVEARDRWHADYRTAGDGTALYQTAAAVQPLDWSYQSMTEASDSESTLTDFNSAPGTPKQIVWSLKDEEDQKRNIGFSPLTSPVSYNTGQNHFSRGEAIPHSQSPRSAAAADTPISDSRQLINDLVWLEKKIADVRKSTTVDGSANNAVSSPAGLKQTDSLSYSSKEAAISPSSAEDSAKDPLEDKMKGIVCRDCFAPPGKLHIVIHSTKDGPAVHRQMLYWPGG